uniref:NADH-ubiquinone oxidoreductase chain 5 n=1 Tax=Exema canadensis TaxID=294585 RepID=U3KZR8_9CUCU|nr:NADH dehydrogenase subunit 5 [Exema canadensis]
MIICLYYSLILMFFSLLMFFMSLYFLSLDLCMILEFNLLMINSSNVSMTVLLDWMSLIFMSFVTFISSAVVFYSKEYMYGDLNMGRFILLVFLFVLSMMFLIISPNLISILLGWDGLGLVSYCLVIYYQNFKSFNAGMLTALSNRIGDVALLMAIAWMFNFGSWNYFFYLDILKADFNLKIVSVLVVLAAMTKSAQIPFSSWLPAAMAAPTPVSSLVHSSTLVTAGVYLLIRFNYCFSSSLMYYLLFISSMTMFMSGLGANFEYDLKKIIALSTLSQLGLMMGILSLGEYQLAFFHLLTHALFKALLFMCAGNMIHSVGGYQDIRFMGGLVNYMPYTVVLFNICNFSLCGLPFLSGFYSKDLILEVSSMNIMNMYMYMIFYLSTGLTVSYSIRLVYYSLVTSWSSLSLGMISEKSYIMIFGMSFLILFVVFSGSMLSWILFTTPYFICLSFLMKMAVLFVIMVGVVIGYEFSQVLFGYTLGSFNKLMMLHFLGSMWNMPFISTFMISKFNLSMGRLYYQVVDQGWSEFYGFNFVSKSLVGGSNYFQLFSLNHLKIYFLMIFIWVFYLFMLI